MLYDNLEFNFQQQRENDRRDTKIDPVTVMDEYEDNYKWTNENLGRDTIMSSINTVIKGLNS